MQIPFMDTFLEAQVTLIGTGNQVGPEYDDSVCVHCGRGKRFTEAERDAAVAGAYRAAFEAARNAMPKAETLTADQGELLEEILGDIEALTPASAQKAFADAVAAEGRSQEKIADLQKSMASITVESATLREQLTRLTEEKERLAKALKKAVDELWHKQIPMQVSAAMPSQVPCADDCVKCLAQAALTPAAGGETKKHEPQ